MTVFIVLILNVLLIVSIYSFSFAKNGNTSFIPLSSSNVILIVVDCLCADRLSCYGYSRKTTPFIDSFTE